MSRILWLITGVLMLSLALAGYWGYGEYRARQQRETETPKPPFTSENVIVTSPLPYQVIASPFEITGQAKGTWFFEASFPIELRDANDVVIATTHAEARGEWMTTDFVPFRALLTFTKPASSTGTLVLKKDNPSGLPQYEASVSFPVKFE